MTKVNDLNMAAAGLRNQMRNSAFQKGQVAVNLQQMFAERDIFIGKQND